MRKILFIVLSVLIFNFPVFSENDSQLIKRTVLIFPFINKNKVEKYNYLKDTLLNALNAELIRADKFNFVNPSKLDDIIEKEKINVGYYENPKNSKEVAIKLKADISVIGQYVIIENKIIIQIIVIDVFTENIITYSNISGEIGIDIFRIIEESSKDITTKMVQNIKDVDKSYFDEMMKIINQKKISEQKNTLTAGNKAGIILLSAGLSFFLIGSSVFIYDMAGYSSVLKEKRDQYINNADITSDEYMLSYRIFIGLFAGSLSVSVIGLTMFIIGLPLSIYKKKDKVTFNIKYDYYHIGLFITLKI